MVVTVVARGTVESAKNNDIYCEVKSGTKGNPVATTVKWLVDNGAKVKKGDVLILLDDTGFQEQLRDKKNDLAKSMAAKESAAENLQLVQKNGQFSVRLKEIDARLAELDLKKYAGKDAEEKEALQLKVELARLHVEQAKDTLAARPRPRQCRQIFRPKRLRSRWRSHAWPKSSSKSRSAG